ncbi:unnamed protein product [Ilex paraguariensis]|uniref:Uncharacterized protein n=1 Tax=Ilex paraguariensis TaxID=185542 RepID=A0ABC8SQU3_9AQUA
MKVIAAYLLAVLGGNTSPSADDLKDILGSGFISPYVLCFLIMYPSGIAMLSKKIVDWSGKESFVAGEITMTNCMIIVLLQILNFFLWHTVGAEAEDDRIELLLSQVKGKDITELIAAGREKLASVPSGGGGAIAVAATAVAGGAAAAPAAAEPKKEEKVEEKEESDEDMGFSLFD